MGVGKAALLLLHQGQHRLPQRLCPRQRLVRRLTVEEPRHQHARRSRLHRPVRHQQRPRPGVDEAPPKTRYRIRAAAIPRHRVAEGAHAPALAGITDEEFVLAGVTSGAGKSVGENAAIEIAAEAALDIRRQRLAVKTAGIPPRRRPLVLGDLLPAAPWITLPIRRFHAIVTDVTPKRDRRFTASVAD